MWSHSMGTRLARKETGEKHSFFIIFLWIVVGKQNFMIIVIIVYFSCWFFLALPF